MTQTDRLLRALERAGRRGITAVDFLLPNVIDGGAPITRLAARVKDARDQGHAIVVDGERDHCAVYKLASAVSSAPAPTPAAAAAPSPAAAHPEPGFTPPAQVPTAHSGAGADQTAGQLFDMPATRRPGNALTEEAA